ncbi:MAG: DUF1800 family protein, partial [Parvularculaceae bacterium]|nr:DUF1800 family protein [Parvularculaceae bacterium]
MTTFSRTALLWISAVSGALWLATGAQAEDISREDAVRFLIQASFGPTEASIRQVQRLGYEGWIEKQWSIPGQSALDRMAEEEKANRKPRKLKFHDYFWEQALYAPDQLRMRTTFALSQIVVIAVNEIDYEPVTFALYVDMLRRASDGNYCDLIREVTYSPAMADYLTYFKNEPADPVTGRAPDENYAREIMQLFTIGLEELHMDGTPKGKETYTSADVEGLASVFTGLASPGKRFKRSRIREANADKPLVGFPNFHEQGPKTFLGTTIPGGLTPEQSVDQALDHLLAHDNIPPFIAKQLIQKFVTSNPSPDYVRRVARAFKRGTYTMPSGKDVGSGQRCDVKAAMAAVLLDREARNARFANDPTFGKVREPVMRLTHVIRALSDDQYKAPTTGIIQNHGRLRQNSAVHNQWAFSPPSVFGFFRPGYVAAGTRTAEAEMVAPEMQVMT